MANTIKIKRGLSSNIDNTTLAQGELAITTDTNELYVGKESGKEKINVQANYNQNDSTASDYVKNRPFYSEWNGFFNQEVSFSYKSITQDNKTCYQLSSNEFDYTFDFDSLLKTTSFIISINGIKHDLLARESVPGIKFYVNYFVTEIAELTEDYIEVQFDDQGKMQIRIYILNEPSSPEDLNKTIILSKETVHKIDSKFVGHPLDFTDEDAVVGTTYEEPTFVLEKHWNETHTHYHTTLELYSAGTIKAN